ncbi:MAG: hypothetical protein ABSF50_18690 [Burkholderiaceae bacterium]|jgi:uncharacterized membrane protein YjjB (DUF3815 family)
MFEDLFIRAHLIDAIVVMVLAEGALLGLWRLCSGTGVPLGQLWPNLCAGLGLLLALRTVVAGGAWHWVAFWLAASLLAHLTDLRARWRQSPAAWLAGPARSPMNGG